MSSKEWKKAEYKLGSVFIKKKKRDSRKYTSRNSETVSLRSTLRLENLNFLLAAVQNLFFSSSTSKADFRSNCMLLFLHFDTTAKATFFTHHLCAHLRTKKKQNLSTSSRTKKFNQASLSCNWSTTIIRQLVTTHFQSVKHLCTYISTGQHWFPQKRDILGFKQFHMADHRFRFALVLLHIRCPLLLVFSAFTVYINTGFRTGSLLLSLAIHRFMNYLHVCHFNIICYSRFAAYRLKKSIHWDNFLGEQSKHRPNCVYCSTHSEKGDIHAILLELKITKEQSGKIFLCITG